jgi:hypothetical protein
MYNGSNMDEGLNRLVSGLTLEERHNLLDKLKGQTSLSEGSLYEADDEEKQENSDLQFMRLPWYYRLYYFILSFFKNQSPGKLFENSRIGRVGREIEAQTPGLYDYQENNLRGEFCRLITELRESARFFYDALDYSVNRDKGGFYIFLGSLEMGAVHSRLQSETDPDLISRSMPDASDSEIRQRAIKIMEEAIASITEDQRNAMYRYARSLNCLKELAAFMFDRVIMAFGFSSASQTCPANVVKEPLSNLNNILFSLQSPPPLPVLESLFIFQLQEKSGGKDFDMGREMRSLLRKAETAVESIRDFNKQVPLTRILRCAFRDLSRSPKQISGGEEWFVVYREHWRRQIEAKIDEFIRARKQHDLINTFSSFFKGSNLKMINYAASDSMPDGFPVPEALTLSFLMTFYSAVFMSDINKTLRPILIDGEFFKRENRTEFTESYNDLIKMEDDIKHFEIHISPKGDLGKRYALAKQDISSLAIRRRKVQLALEDASREASEIVDCSRNAMKTMIDVLNGILLKDPGGKYDSLSNLAQLSGKTPLVFTGGVTDSIEKLQQALYLLEDINVISDDLPQGTGL